MFRRSNSRTRIIVSEVLTTIIVLKYCGKLRQNVKTGSRVSSESKSGRLVTLKVGIISAEEQRFESVRII